MKRFPATEHVVWSAVILVHALVGRRDQPAATATDDMLLREMVMANRIHERALRLSRSPRLQHHHQRKPPGARQHKAHSRS